MSIQHSSTTPAYSPGEHGQNTPAGDHWPAYENSDQNGYGSHQQMSNHHQAGSARAEKWRRTGYAALYLLAKFPIALIGFVLTLTLFAVGVGTIIIWVGLPILVAGLLLARGLADTERVMQRGMLGKRTPRPEYVDSDRGRISRLLAPLRDPQSWLDLLYQTVSFVVGTASFCIALTWIVGSIGMVGGPIAILIVDAALPQGDMNGLAELLGFGTGVWLDAVISFLAGAIFFVTLTPVLRGLAAMHSALAYLMLGSRADTQREIGELKTSRAAVRSAETTSLRRLERDIHDGPQQRLVRLNMDLARARRMAASDPERAQMLLAEAMDQTQDTLSELRQLSRGIAPPVLVDRGLGAAVAELAGRSGVPTSVAVDVGQLPEHVETAAYFVASEALANANKHSGAEQIAITGEADTENLVVSVTDDGVGGAGIDKGHGLAGLENRLAGVDGQLTVTSPQGGPTVVQAIIPIR